LAGFQVIIYGRFWVFTEEATQVDAEAAGLGIAETKGDERRRSEISESEWSRAAERCSCSGW
jgi:hypothetical protein